MSRIIHLVLPSLRPMGGVVKAFDLATHALAADFGVTVFAPEVADPELPVFRIDRFASMPSDDRVRFTTDDRIRLRGDDLGLLSLPSQYELLLRGLPRQRSPERVIHYVQNVRHANPTWLGGVALRLLGRPFARISTNDVVAEAIAPFQHPRSLGWTIPLGHPLGHFTRPEPRGQLADPVRVAYTTWKSDLGDRVAARLDGTGFTFRAVRESVGWDELRSLYHWADVFLGTPNREEGFYMPAFEAMEAGAVVVVPDVGGNMAFCRFDENCIGVGFDDEDDYVDALERVRAMSELELGSVRRAATAALAPFDLQEERRRFHAFLRVLDRRVRAVESGEVDPRTLDRHEGEADT